MYINSKLSKGGSDKSVAKMKHKKFHTRIRQNIFRVQMVKHWNEWPREITMSLSLGE